MFKKSNKTIYSENLNNDKIKPFLKKKSEKIIKQFSKKKIPFKKEITINEKILKKYEKKNLEELDLSYQSKIKRFKRYKYKIFIRNIKKK